MTGRIDWDYTKLTNHKGFPIAVVFEGREYLETGKYGTNIATGAEVLEYSITENGVEDRIWATADGQIFPD